MSMPVLNPDQEKLLTSLREDYEELCAGVDPSVPAPDLDDALLARFVRADSAYATLPRKFLGGCGFELKTPSSIDEADLPGELWQVIWVMALLRLLLDHTDHLTDRELYERLYETELMEPVNFQPGEIDASIYVLDLLGGGSREENELLLTYYAERLDEPVLDALKSGFLGEVPEPAAPPADRDRFLP